MKTHWLAYPLLAAFIVAVIRFAVYGDLESSLPMIILGIAVAFASVLGSKRIEETETWVIEKFSLMSDALKELDERAMNGQGLIRQAVAADWKTLADRLDELDERSLKNHEMALSAGITDHKALLDKLDKLTVRVEKIENDSY